MVTANANNLLITYKDMSKVDEDINNQVSEVPPKKRKTQEDKEIEKIEVESTGGGFDAGGG
jgi:hypothetical protein